MLFRSLKLRDKIKNGTSTDSDLESVGQFEAAFNFFCRACYMTWECVNDTVIFRSQLDGSMIIINSSRDGLYS